MKQISTKAKSWINLIVFLITLIFNYLTASGFINGMSQKVVSNKYNTLITPAGFAFSIWGIIYSLIGISLIYMLVKGKETKVKNLIGILTPIILFNFLFNILWNISFSYEKIGFSTICISLILISLILINKKLYVHRKEIEYRLTSVAFGIYAGWITIASFVNMLAFLVSINWDGFGISQTIWAPIILLIIIVISILINVKLNNAVYFLPIAWAIFGIVIKINKAENTVIYGPYMMPLGIVGIVILILLSIIQFKKNKYCVIEK